MRARVARAVLAPNHGYVCLSCRLQSVEVEGGRTRRYQHSGPKDEDGSNRVLKNPPENVEKADPPVTSSRIREIIRGFMGGQKTKPLVKETLSSQAANKEAQKQPSPMPDTAISSDVARQQKLQQQFTSQRRKDMLDMQASNIDRVPERNDAKEILKTQSKPGGKRKLSTHHYTRGARRKHKRDMAKKALELAPASALTQESQAVAATAEQASDDPATILAQLEPTTDKEKGGTIEVPSQTEPQVETPKETNTKAEGNVTTDNTLHDPPVSTANTKDPTEKPKSIPKESKPKAGPKNSGSKKAPSKSKKKPTAENKKTAPTEAERKAQLAKRLDVEEKKIAKTFRKCESETKRPLLSVISKHKIDAPAQVLRKVQSKKRIPATEISDVEGFESFQSALGGKTTKIGTTIEKADAAKLEILPVEVDQPPVPSLSYGLERVLFNPGVYQLQDPRSRVYNFDPYLQKIMPVAEFDFNALKEYITSSRDESLKRIAKEHDKRYVGSTSSMTGVLAHFHFLLSQWRPINATMLSKTFPTQLTSFTELQRTPSAIFLRWKDGSYAIDADKQFANANVLSMLGKSMEKLLTLNTEDYERYRKSSLGQVTEDEQFAPESYHYSTMGDFLMRSQLDAHDLRLPGTGMFDLKTRAVVSVRMDVSKYEQGTGYQIKSRQGEWESYEREYYDMIRAAFLKYSMQVRMGRMDGIFVAFHNVERIFGFQYISLPEMDSTIHGQWDTSIGDQEFKLGLDLLNKALDKATAKFPQTSIRLHFETREAQTPFMYIFAEPVTEDQVAEVQSANAAKIQEFERNILGLSHGEEFESGSESEATQEDDGKWENIQAEVQKEMDKDELSLDDPSQDQEVEEAEDLDVEDNGHVSDIQGIFEEGPLYANKRSAEADGDATAPAVGSEDGDVEGGEDDADDEAGADSDEQDLVHEREEDQEVDEAENVEVEETDQGQENQELTEGEEAHDAENSSGEEGLMEDSIAEKQAFDQDIVPASEDEAEAKDNLDRPTENDIASSGDASNNESSGGEAKPTATQDTTKSLSMKELKEKARADYIPPVGEEQSDFQTEADQPFLDAINGEVPQVNEATEDAPDILAMTLTLRNKVNGQYTLRPEGLTDKDKWSIEYSLIEVPTQRRARALYEACQSRRKKKMDTPLVPEDAETINLYIQNLRKMSRKGREWRKEQDKKDSENSVQVLGQELVQDAGEGDSVYQEPEA